MDTSSVEARYHLLQGVDLQIKVLEEAIRATKSHHNALVPISRLPPEVLAHTFFLLGQVLGRSSRRQCIYFRSLLCATHVCRHWRETALNFPHLWSHIDFTKLAADAGAEILARAKLVPLHLMADPTLWSQEEFDFFESQVEAHSPHIHHLGLSRVSQAMLGRLVSPAPALEFLSLSNTSDQLPPLVIPNALFNRTAPKLISLELTGYGIHSKSALLKGLQTLKIQSLPKSARPTLEDWLDTLNEMPQLRMLTLGYASPSNSLGDRLISETQRTVLLPSLTRFDIAASVEDCALALAHLIFPVLTSLHVDAEYYNPEGSGVGLLIPHVARSAHGPQDAAPLQSITIRGGVARVEIIAWTVPDADVEDYDSITILGWPRVAFFATAMNSNWWCHQMETRILDASLMHLPTNAISTLTVEEDTPLDKEFWQSHASSLAMLERVRLFPAAVRAFRETLAEDSPPHGPRFPRLTELILVNFSLTALRAYNLHNLLRKRVEQGAPLETLDLRTCIAAERAIQLLGEIVGDVQGPAETLETGEPRFFNWKGGVEFFDEEEKLADDLEYKFGLNPWYCSSDDNEQEYEYESDDYDEDSELYSDEL